MAHHAPLLAITLSPPDVYGRLLEGTGVRGARLKFHNDKPIFLQIVADIEDQILSGRLLPEARTPAIRDYAIAVEVNPNTVVRSFVLLEESGVIFKKRGLGYFIAPEARAIILQRNRNSFIAEELPETVRKMKLLDIPLKELVNLYQKEAGDQSPPPQEKDDNSRDITTDNNHPQKVIPI